MTQAVTTFLPRAAAVAALACGFMGIQADPAQACPSMPYVGTTCVVGFNFCPTNWLPADGRTLPISGNEALYSLIGTTYGGSGSQFNLPDLRGRTLVGAGQGPGLTNLPLGSVRGVEVAPVPVPVHTHAATFVPGTQVANSLSASLAVNASNAANPTGNTNGPSAGSYLSSTPATGFQAGKIWNTQMTAGVPVGGITVTPGGGSGDAITGGTVTVANSGSAPGPIGSATVLPPQLGLTTCIATQGVYPQRP